MTTFEGIVFGILQGVTEFLPVGARAHLALVPQLFGLTAPEPAMLGALSLGSVLALLLYFRHDWASMISSFLQVVIYRKYPMTLDERMPFFLLIAVTPIAIAWYYFNDSIQHLAEDPIWTVATLAAFGALLGLADYFGRKSKGMFDWNGMDSAVIGMGMIIALVPGAGLVGSAMLLCLFRNYRRESAAKFTFFLALPILVASAILHLKGVSFRSAAPSSDFSWITFIVACLVTVFFGVLTLGGFMKHIQRKGMGVYVTYRILAAIAVLIWLQFKDRASLG